jgi:hypothetical protein
MTMSLADADGAVSQENSDARHVVGGESEGYESDAPAAKVWNVAIGTTPGANKSGCPRSALPRENMLRGPALELPSRPEALCTGDAGAHLDEKRARRC